MTVNIVTMVVRCAFALLNGTPVSMVVVLIPIGITVLVSMSFRIRSAVPIVFVMPISIFFDRGLTLRENFF